MLIWQNQKNPSKNHLKIKRTDLLVTIISEQYVIVPEQKLHVRPLLS